MGKTTELRQELKQRFFPFLERKGFSCDMRDAPQFFTFRKILGDQICVLDIQWDSHGRRRFAVNFSVGSLDEIVPHDKKIAPQDVFVHHFKRRGRLKSGRQLRFFQVDRQWFSQDPGLIERLLCRNKRSANQVIDDLLSVFPEVEDFFEKREVGRHMSVWSN